jgi:RNA polymerase sigma factor (TIGR02999 family)
VTAPEQPGFDVPAEFTEAYAELRAVAGAYMRRFPDAASLAATGLVHEVYLKIAQDGKHYADRAHFVSTAAKAMRHILVDHARARDRLKRGGDMAQVTLGGPHGADPSAEETPVDVLALHEALLKLARWDARQAQIVELRFFVGLSVDEVAALLGISEKTVKRDWAMARAWLQREIAPDA